MRVSLRPALLLSIVILVVTACSGTAASSGNPPGPGSPSASPVATPSSTTDPDRVDHATGAADVILRYDEGGGFVMPAFFASLAPIFTLYGDGTVIFRNPTAEAPPAVGGAMPNRPYRIAKLTEDQVQETLVMAIGVGGLGTARLDYPNDMIADAGTALFTLKAGGIDKTVSVYALGLDAPGVPDAGARAAFGLLARQLSDFDRGGSIPTEEYAPAHYRGILMEGFPGEIPPKPWPWADLTPADFVLPADPDALSFPTHTLTATQVEALGIEPYTGGIQNISLSSPDKRALYSLAVRPLLPDDKS